MLDVDVNQQLLAGVGGLEAVRGVPEHPLGRQVCLLDLCALPTFQEHRQTRLV